ncbi:MAG: hypothetical protein PHQ35_03255 [Phycisphaerae bacterium]|nr:hypothetical protein [Phycisphaerae bacterium]MDD5380689.1 hypothetical protein [Phycisphaerae bacterium]
MPAIQTKRYDEFVRPVAPSNYKMVWIVVLVVGLLQGLYSVGFIAKTSFVVEGHRYFCLFDDAMISMRYAANWADGHGFVWNPGERVEGYTTFGWTFVMGICHLFRLSPSYTCLLVQVLGVPILWGCLISTALLARYCKVPPVSACCAIVLAGTFYNLIFFTLFGMETGLLTLLVTLAMADTIKYISEGRGGIRPVLWFAPAALVRPDVLAVMLFVLLFFWFSVKKDRFRLLIGLLIVALVVAAHFLWRYRFYGQWLPNTYYLKLTGWSLPDRIAAGIKQTFWTVAVFGLPLLLAAIAVIKDTKRWHFLVLGSFAIAVVYQVYVGGDAWPLHRFVIPYSLGLFVLAAEGINRIAILLINRKTDAPKTAFRLALTALCVVAVNGINWDHCLLLARPQTTGGGRMDVRAFLAVEKVADPNASVAVRLAGVYPYFSRRLCFDLLGKCDPYIAHLPAHSEISRAGHNKFDYAYSFAAHKPDIVLHTITTDDVFYRHYRPIIVEADGTKMVLYVRKDNPVFDKYKTPPWPEVEKCFLEMQKQTSRDF